VRIANRGLKPTTTIGGRYATNSAGLQLERSREQKEQKKGQNDLFIFAFATNFSIGDRQPKQPGVRSYFRAEIARWLGAASIEGFYDPS